MKYSCKEDFEKENIFGTGLPNDAYARYFVGRSFLNPLTGPETGVLLSNVTFERRRAAFALHGRRRLVSRGGKTGGQPYSRNGRVYPGQCEALAWR